MMRRSKKIFTAFAIAFFLLLAYVVYDISNRTTFPGSRSPEKERPETRTPLNSDSVTRDSVK